MGTNGLRSTDSKIKRKRTGKDRLHKLKNEKSFRGHLRTNPKKAGDPRKRPKLTNCTCVMNMCIL